MNLLILCLFVLGATCVVANPSKGSSLQLNALKFAQDQVTAILHALQVNDKATFFKLLKTTAEDQNNFDKFAEVFKGITVTVKSAKIIESGVIDVIILLAGEHQVKLIMEKSLESLTGWIVNAIGQPSSLNRHIADWFSMCYIGLLWCAIEVVADWRIRANQFF